MVQYNEIIMERNKGEGLTVEERLAKLSEPYRKATQEYLETSRRHFIERGWDDPGLMTDEQFEQNLQAVYKATRGVDLAAIIKRRAARDWRLKI